MKVCSTVKSLRKSLEPLRGKFSIGFVPTMGALHAGHISLIEQAKSATDITVASIFVNPTQFNNREDLTLYPRTLEADLRKLEEAGCDYVFTPSTDEMYPQSSEVTLKLGSIANELEGKFRPGHFDGVGLVVSKLFNIVQPQKAFFGQKDLQQYFVIQKLISEFNFPVHLFMVPTKREPGGLAMSSRNERLASSDRQEACLLYQALQKAQQLLLQEHSIEQAKKEVKELIASSGRLQLEYFEVVSTADFKPLKKVENKQSTALCIAAEIGGVRLIDNLLLIS
ncbi:pantoate--beta-alanine ligase [Roseivirga sp. UBA1976]|uniref:pantoate--beta-alanine ligase n=1 Tax=Roseivirga sp. UBA1976 TaxID=1947386 RepID=UPI0025806639|nr:pantoate--beta-alanine ligase [Roseivirga sp. UBA1976]MEC7754353.1 pantoate--beta-alanine ligase [Bacteroidota bacterium]|tara:strand:+ start:50357 stop:51202 length:846 start_codon:yes stop_codon:yes gene_type:complete